MKIRIWTVAADDDEGTRATVHLTEREAYQQWLELQFSGGSDEKEKAEKEAAAAFIEREDYGGLWAWEGDRELGEPFDTYAIEEHEIEVPGA
jgi:hypothetical protein